ncbi:MAG: hypothetical protein JEY99_07280 [Spirochaetales bacterium]|nr:hypothetical protein [Spirochaetales bacterium]
MKKTRVIWLFCIVFFITSFCSSCEDEFLKEIEQEITAATHIPPTPVVQVESPTTNTKPIWSWNLPAGIVNFRFQLGAESGTWQVTGGSGTLGYSPLTDQPDGSYTLFVQAANELGNWSESGTATVVIDTSDPVISAGSTIEWTRTPVLPGATAEDRTAMTYTWSKVSGNGNILFDNASLLTPVISGQLETESEYTLQLTVIDDTNHIVSDQMVFKWDHKAPAPGDSGTITISEVSTSSLTLDWSAGSDLSTLSTALEYKVVASTQDNINTVISAEISGEGRFTVMDWAADTLNTNVSGLNIGSLYYFNVLVRDRLANTAMYGDVSQDLNGILGLSITVNTPWDEILTFDEDDDVVVQQPGTLTVSVNESFDGYGWELYGYDLSSETGNSVTLDSSVLSPGVHHLYVFTDRGSSQFSENLRFVVENGVGE